MRGRFQIAVTVVPGQQHVVSEQFICHRRGALDGGVKSSAVPAEERWRVCMVYLVRLVPFMVRQAHHEREDVLGERQLNPFVVSLMELLAIRLGCQTTPAKSLVMSNHERINSVTIICTTGPSMIL